VDRPPPPSPSPPPPPPAAQCAAPATGWATPKPTGPAPGIAFASHGARLLAFIIDAVLLGLVVGSVFLVVVAGMLASQSLAGFFGILAVVFIGQYLLPALYFGVFWWRQGATPGMRAMHIRVVRAADGGPITGQQAFLRAVGYWVSATVFYLGYVWILFDDRHQGWHDKIAETFVIEAR
jgi:uncharacterized RDD family membrane protein YckC